MLSVLLIPSGTFFINVEHVAGPSSSGVMPRGGGREVHVSRQLSVSQEGRKPWPGKGDMVKGREGYPGRGWPAPLSIHPPWEKPDGLVFTFSGRRYLSKERYAQGEKRNSEVLRDQLNDTYYRVRCFVQLFSFSQPTYCVYVYARFSMYSNAPYRLVMLFIFWWCEFCTKLEL